MGGRENRSIFILNINAIILRLQKTGAPSAHAWRGAWAMQALRNGVSETSVLATAGWSSGAMVARYQNASSGELAVRELQRSW